MTPKQTKIALGALGVLSLVFLAQRREGGKVQEVKQGQPSHSLDDLVPAFREKVVKLMDLMRVQGFEPLVWETSRTKERAAKLAKEGVGVEDSMHTLGLAVDIIDAKKYWSASDRFWLALHSNATKLGLVRVQRKQKNGKKVWDLPHVQAAPEQYKAKMHKLTVAERDKLLREIYERKA